MKYKSVFVPAPAGTFERETMLRGTQTEESPHLIDGLGLAEDCTTACNQLADESYEVVTITEITCGNERMDGRGGAGWSHTHGVLITARQLV